MKEYFFRIFMDFIYDFFIIIYFYEYNFYIACVFNLCIFMQVTYCLCKFILNFYAFKKLCSATNMSVKFTLHVSKTFYTSKEYGYRTKLSYPQLQKRIIPFFPNATNPAIEEQKINTIIFFIYHFITIHIP